MHVLRLLGLGIVLGLLLVGIGARQDLTINENAAYLYRTSLSNPGVRSAVTSESKMERAKKWLERQSFWSFFG